MALSVLAEKLVPTSHRKCQAPEFRMKWKFASTCDVREFEPFVVSAYNFKFSLEWSTRPGRLRGVNSACRDMVFVAAACPEPRRAFRRAGYDCLQDRWCQATQNEHLRKKGGGYPLSQTGFSRRCGGAGEADCKSLGGGTRMGWVRQTSFGDAACS
jgi:hypothetical protein